MKHLAKFMACALVVGMWSCKSEEPLPGGDQTPGSEGDVFAQLTLSLPSTRSTTNTEDDNEDHPASSTNGNEVGKDYENNVNDLWVLLASKDETTGAYSYVAKSQTNAILNQSVVAPTYSVQFQSDELEKYANSGQEGNTASKDIYVFAYCNPSTDLAAALGNLPGTLPAGVSSFTELIATLTDGDNLPWAKKNGFTMTNALITKSSLPNYQILISDHNTKAKALDLGTVKVERVVSRFDFMATTNDGLAANQYMIKDNVSGLNMAIVEMEGLSLMNEAKEFYYLPRMSANTDWTAPVLCGYELSNNWVVSPNYDEKIAFANAYTQANAYGDIKDNYFFNCDLTLGELNYTSLSTVLGNDEDNKGWEGSTDTDYHIWRYATENTMPTTAQITYITTGVAFRAEIKALEDSQITGQENGTTHPAATLKAAMTDGATLYAFANEIKNPENNVMLGAAKDVWKYAYTHATSAIRSQFMKAVAAGAFTVTRGGTTMTSEAEIFPEPTAEVSFETIVENTTVAGVGNIADLNDNNFQAYIPEDGHYYVYYRYWNRHNDNDRPDVMGPMEFATVRNNIYKLKVSEVKGFGLPGTLPTPPPTKDENPEVFFKVSVRVLDWVVRVNNIEF